MIDSLRPFSSMPHLGGIARRRRLVLLLGLLLPPAPANAQAPILEIQVEGNSRLPSQSIIAVSGLTVGTMTSRKDLDAAAQRLFDTGFFRSTNYRYQPKRSNRGTGYVVTLQVSEEEAERPVQLDIPGVDEKQLWEGLQRADALIDTMMPDNEQSAAYYQRAIEAELDRSNRRVQITMMTEADLTTGRMVAIFRPLHLPSLTEIRFEDNQQIPLKVLTTAVSGLVLGKDYSERSLRQILDLNVKPLYEEKALLTVSFPSVTIVKTGDQMVSATVSVEEGPAWTLGKVDILGDALPLDEIRKAATFPQGKPANWKQVSAGIAAMEKVLRKDGYLGVSSKPERLYRGDAGVVDVVIRVKRGKQFVFGALQLNGLSPMAERESRALWKLREGEPMNGPYIDEYLRSVVSGPAGEITSVRQDLRVRPGTNVIDVVITFK